MTARSHIVGVENNIERELEKIRYKEIEMQSTAPVLGYIFFEFNSDNIPGRYAQYSSSEDANNFNFASLHNKGTIHTYHNVLNIIGKRMQENRKAYITLTGTNSNQDEERNNISLSIRRAKSVAEYLINIWEIDPDHIKIESVNLPEKASNTSSEEGKEENRRVEIGSSYPDILSPVITIDTVYEVLPELIRFKEPARVKFGEAFWKIKLTQNDIILREFEGEGSTNYDIDWNILEELSAPKNDKPVYYELEVNDKEIQKTIVAKDTIPVEIISLKDKIKIGGDEKIYEKFSLILFDFGSSKISGDNEQITQIINSKINSNSNIKVIGYTDRTGDDKFNEKLSQKRAESAAEELRAGNIIVEGMGESKLLYDNDLPEGRFYCRTVDIIIETSNQAEQTYNSGK